MKKSAVALLLLSLVMLFMLAGCGKKVETKIIVDGEEVTCMAKSSNTVADVLEQNTILISDKDEVEPALDSEIGETTPEIKVYRNKVVIIKVDGKDTEVELTKGTVADAIEKAGITLGKNDRLSVDKTENVTHGMEITIERGVSIKVTVAGKAKNYVTTEKTVAHALRQLKIKYDKDDIVEPSKSAKIKRGMKITVKKVEVKQETEEKGIPFATKTEYSASMEKGQSKVKQAGVNGKKTVVSKNTYIDGELTSSEVIEEKVITDAVNKIVVYGSKVTTTAAPTTKAPAATKTPTTKAPTTAGKHFVSKERVEDCDGSGHGYYVITYSDGSVVYQDFNLKNFFIS